MKKLTKIILLPFYFLKDSLEMFVTHLPGNTGILLRYYYYKKKLKYLGKKVKISPGVTLSNPEFISIDDNVWIDKNVTIIAGLSKRERITYKIENPETEKLNLKKGEVFIGKNTHIAINCVISGIGGVYIGSDTTIAATSVIYSYSHHYRNLNDKNDDYQYSFTSQTSDDKQSMIEGPVFIGDNSAIGLNSVVLPGSIVGKGTWFGCSSVIKGKYKEQKLITPDISLKEKSINNLKIK